MKTTQITINRNIPVLIDGKKTKDAKTGYNVTEQIKFKGTQHEFNNDLVLIPDYGNHKKCPVKTACKLSGKYTKLIKNNLKVLKLNYCYSADGYKGAYFGTKKTNVTEVMEYLKSIKTDSKYLDKIAKIDDKKKAEKKADKKQGDAVNKVGAKGDFIQLQEQVRQLTEMISNLQTS